MSGLGATASRGAAVTLGGQLVRLVVQLAGIVLLARLLAPADYGLLAMVLAITGVGEVLRDFGLSSAAVQAKTITTAQRSGLFWINTGIGAALTVVAAGLSWPIAALYGDDRLQPLAALLGITFLLNGAAAQFRADLNRSMRFGRLAVIDTVAQLVGLALALAAALAGWGVWALAVQQLVPVVLQLVGLVPATGWLPGRPRRRAGLRPFLAFGSNLAAVQLLAYASRNVDSVVIGATVGAQALGYYNRAYQLMNLPLNQLNAPSTRVALPVLSRLQDQPARFAAFLSTGQTVLLNLGGAVVALSAAQAGSLVQIGLGPQWEPVVPLFQILAVAGFFTVLGYASYWVFLAKGIPNAILQMSLVTRPAMICLVLLGSVWGAGGVAAAYALGCALLWPTALLQLRRRSDAPVGMMFVNGLRALIVFALAGGASWGASVLLVPADGWARLAVGSAAFVVVIAVLALAWPAYRRDLVTIAGLKRQLRAARAPARSAAQGEEAQRDGMRRNRMPMVDMAVDGVPVDGVPVDGVPR